MTLDCAQTHTHTYGCAFIHMKILATVGFNAATSRKFRYWKPRVRVYETFDVFQMLADFPLLV